MDQQKLKSIIESLLFISGEPIKVRVLVQVSGASTAEVKEAMESLRKDYQDSQRGLRIMEKDEEVQMVTAIENSEFVAKMVEADLRGDLTRASVETLAIVAYRGPLTRAKVEEIRGVNCSFALRYLLIRGLVERIDNPEDSRSYLYRPSFDFLKKLGLEKISDLPRYEELSKKVFPGEEKAERDDSQTQNPLPLPNTAQVAQEGSQNETPAPVPNDQNDNNRKA